VITQAGPAMGITGQTLVGDASGSSKVYFNSVAYTEGVSIGNDGNPGYAYVSGGLTAAGDVALNQVDGSLLKLNFYSNITIDNDQDIIVGGGAATTAQFVLDNGTINEYDVFGPGADLIINEGSTMTGWGTVNITGGLTIDGDINADGGALQFFNANTISNTVSGVRLSATNDGILDLGLIPLAAGDQSATWGDVVSEQPDIQNAIRMDFTGIDGIGGDVLVSMLDPATGSGVILPADMAGILPLDPIGLWDISPFFGFESVDITVAWDQSAAVEWITDYSNLSFYHFDGFGWSELPKIDMTWDLVNKRVTISNVVSLSPIALVNNPEPSTWILIIIGIGVLGWKKRKKLFK